MYMYVYMYVYMSLFFALEMCMKIFKKQGGEVQCCLS